MEPVTLALLTCDRPELFETVNSIEERLHGPIVDRICMVDGATPDRVAALQMRLGSPWRVLSLSDELQGYGAAMRQATALAGRSETPWVLWFEDDFKLLTDIDLADFAGIMEAHPEIAQVCMKRQAVWPGELAAGTIFCGDEFEQCDGYVRSNHYWTANPSLMPTWVYRDNPWPEGADSEKAFGDALYPKGYWTATYGNLDDPPRIEHLAGKRTNIDY